MKEFDECGEPRSPRAGDFIATPSPLGDGCTIDWSPVGLVNRVRQALSVTDRCFESTVLKALKHTWVKWHQNIDFRAMPGIFGSPARTACFDACACVWPCRAPTGAHVDLDASLGSLVGSFPLRSVRWLHFCKPFLLTLAVRLL